MKIQNVKGGYDFLPKEQKIRNYINEILKTTFEEFGYQPIETPILCYLDMLVDKYDENNDLLKEIYKLTDQGDRKLGLRYDLTVPFAKFIALNKNNISFPFKRYEIAKVFRDGPVKVGRDREFTQCDADVVGISGELVEAELLSLYISAFKRLGIDIIIKYNNRNLMRGLISEVGIEDSKISSVITIIDKMNKITEAELVKYLVDLGIEEIKVSKTNVLVKTRLNHTPEEDFEQDDIVQKRKGECEHACVCRLLEYQGVNSDNAGGIRSQLKTVTPNNSTLKIDATQIIKDMENLKENAKIWQETGSVHVAQLIYKNKSIIREDVSRHVAVDKVIGAAFKSGYDLTQSYITYSGRMPADMIIKVIRVGIPIIISNAAPAASGYEIAKKGNITMVGFVRNNRFNLYSAPQRINLEK